MTDQEIARPQLQGMLFEANKKSVGVTYLLWFFLGVLGMHRFYAGKSGTGAMQLTLFILGWLTVLAGIGLIALFIEGVWVLVDALLIPGMIRDYNTRLAYKMSR